MSTKTDIAEIKKDDGPSYLANQTVQHQRDNFDSSDVAIPRIKLLHGTSKECEAFDTASPGVFWHTGMDLALGTEVDFVIISRNKKYLLVAPLDDGQGILARADDAKTWDTTGSWEVKIDKKNKTTWTISDTDVMKSGVTEWGTFDSDDKNSPPAATLFYDYIIMLPDHPELGIAVLSVARSQITKAKKGLNDKIELQKTQGRPMQALRFRMKSITEANDAGQDYKSLQFTMAGWTPEGVYKSAVEAGKNLGAYKIQDELDGAQGDGSKSKPDAKSDKEKEY